jgi:glyoxylase-like metal-dependent hydrolase (beta-lactamase superfamily II)
MIFKSTGSVSDNFFVIGNAQFPVYLMDDPSPVLFEGGVTAAGKLYADAIKSILNNRKPRFLFLTHAHWDHCGAVSYLKTVFPSLIVAASKKVSEVLLKNRAQKLMIDLNRKAEKIIASTPSVEPSYVLHQGFRPFKIDMIVEDGQSIKLEGGGIVQIMSTPGHTRDFMTYYLPEKKILVSSESSGCLNSNGKISTQFLADYDDYLSSLKRIARLPVDILCQGHRLVFVGRDEVAEFFSRSICETERFRDKVYSLLEQEDGVIDRVIRRIKGEEYDTINGVKQPEIPYLINLRAQILHLIKIKRGDNP